MNEYILKHIKWLDKMPSVLSISTLTACGGNDTSNNTNLQQPGGPSSDSTINVMLTWNPNSAANEDNYAINYGTSFNTVTTSAANIPTTLPSFNPSSPPIVFDVATKFGITAAEQICFNVRAYNDTGFTTPSPFVCLTL